MTAASSGTVTMNKSNMVAGQKYSVTLTVSSPGRTSASTYVEVNIVKLYIYVVTFISGNYDFVS